VVSRDNEGAITQISLDYSEGYAEQMIRYSKEHSWLPVFN